MTPPNLVPPGRTWINPNAYDNRSFSLRLGAAISDQFDVGLASRYIATPLYSTSDDVLGRKSMLSRNGNTEVFTRGFAHMTLFDGRLDQTLGLAYTEYDRSYTNPNIIPAVPSLYEGQRVKLDYPRQSPSHRRRGSDLWRRARGRSPARTATLSRQELATARASRSSSPAWAGVSSIRQACAMTPTISSAARRNLSHRARFPHSGNRNQAQRQHRHGVRGANARRTLRQLSSLWVLRQSKPEAGKKLRLRRRDRTNFATRPHCDRHDLVCQ